MPYQSPYDLSSEQQKLPDDNSDFEFSITTNLERLLLLFAVAQAGGLAFGLGEIGDHNVDLFESLASAVTPPIGVGSMEFTIAKWELPSAQLPPAPTTNQWWDIPINISVPNPAPDWIQITGNIMRLQPGTYGLFAFMDINAVNYVHTEVRLFNKTGSLVVASGNANQFDNQTIATVATKRAFGGFVLPSVADIAFQAFIPPGVPAQFFGNPSANGSTNWADIIIIKI